MELSQILAVDCLPSGKTCNPSKLTPGELAVIVTRKCHQLTFVGEHIFLNGPNGEEAVLHASPGTQEPTTEVALPEGWSIARKTLDEPLTIHPFGGEGACTDNVIRDALEQSTTRSPTQGTPTPDAGMSSAAHVFRRVMRRAVQPSTPNPTGQLTPVPPSPQ